MRSMFIHTPRDDCYGTKRRDEAARLLAVTKSGNTGERTYTIQNQANGAGSINSSLLAAQLSHFTNHTDSQVLKVFQVLGCDAGGDALHHW
jgi:hypothetical protein